MAADESDTPAQALRDLGEMLASALAGPGTTAPARTVGRRYEAVADQMMASLDAYGLPHEGVQLALTDDEAAARARLIDGLKRNFAFKDEDGYRTYFRSSAQPVARDGVHDSRLLRGATLVNAITVRGAAEGIMTAIDQMPDLDRFVLAHPRRAELRDRIRRLLDQLNETASDPMGVNVPRGSILCDRLDRAVSELVTASGLLPMYQFSDREAGISSYSFDDRTSIFEQLRDRASAVRNEEVKATVLALCELANRIRKVVTEQNADMGRGLAAARLEELLSTAYLSAVTLEEDLNRAGTSVAEQSVQFFNPVGNPKLSIGQYLGWVRAVCEPFTGASNDSADLMYDEAGMLAREVGNLSNYAVALRHLNAAGTGVGLPGVRRQLDELGRMLGDALECAKQIVNPKIAFGEQSSQRAKP